MLIDAMGGVVITNDGHAIVREVDVAHPAAKSMLELCRAQDEEVGDGTTSVIILSGEILAATLPFLEKKVHPTIIINGYRRALQDALKVLDEISRPVDVHDDKQMLALIATSVGTKIGVAWSDLICNLALKSVRTVAIEYEGGKKEVDTKRYARIEKIPGGLITDSEWIDGVVLNKDIVHPNMRRRIEKPRIILLDCSLEYKKGESQMNIELSKVTDWKQVLELEEAQIKEMCDFIIALKPDLLISEKGISDLAQHYLMKSGISALRRVKKSDSYRIAKVCGANIVNRLEDLKESDVGKGAGVFYVDKIGEEYFSFIRNCPNSKACTMILRGPNKDIINEIERNLHDAIGVARNIYFNPRLSPGGGATEIAIATRLEQLSRDIQGIERLPYRSIAQSLEVIPRILIQNCGGDPINILTELKSKHMSGEGSTWGVNGLEEGQIVDMREYGIWEPALVKSQTIKTAIESACMILRVDDIIVGSSNKGDNNKTINSSNEQSGPSMEDAAEA